MVELLSYWRSELPRGESRRVLSDNPFREARLVGPTLASVDSQHAHRQRRHWSCARRKEVRRGQVRRFEIIFRPDSDEAPIPLESAVDANQATMVFHAEFRRLMREGTPGELVIVNHHDRPGSSEGNPILRQPLR